MSACTDQTTNRREKDGSTISILLLGPTGVGKSTWINGLSNCLRFPCLSDAVQAARQGDDFMPIPMTFTDVDPITYEQRTISTGSDQNEIHDKEGETVTRSPRVYNFAYGDEPTYIKIIDTPGLDDTRGREYDRQNVESILRIISMFKTLHCICVLFKTNETRRTDSFAYCIAEVMRRLHDSACQNVAFCFTHAKGSNYAPGQSLPILRDMLKDNAKLERVSMNPSCIYCFESEAVRLLAKILKSEKSDAVSEDEVRMHEQSWIKSMEATRKLIGHARQLRPHSVLDTISLNNAKLIIDVIAYPLLSIVKVAVVNEQELDNARTLITRHESTTFENGTVKVLMRQVVTEELDHSITVCTDARCVDVVEGQVIHRTACDPRCVYAPLMYLCTAMDIRGNCKVCRHDCSKHKWMTTKTSIATVVQDLHPSEIEDLVSKLQYELKRMIVISAQLSVFLKTYGLYGLESNDGVVYDTFKADIDTIETNLRWENDAGVQSLNGPIVELLKRVLSQLKDEIQRLERERMDISASTVNDLIQELCRLHYSGPPLKHSVTIIEKCNEAAIAESCCRLFKVHAVPEWLGLP